MQVDVDNIQEAIEEFLQTVGLPGKDMYKYLQACVHRSALNEYGEIFTDHNERLEFLGDAVLELVITEILYKDFPDNPEGWMTDVRSSLVRGDHLGAVALRLGFDAFILVSKGERRAGGNKNISLLADMFEAFLGAMYLDQGFDNVRNFIKDTVYIGLEDILKYNKHQDPKSQLQEITQSLDNSVPEYKILSEIGMDHEKVFEIEVYALGMQAGVGKGPSKKKAQESAAMNAIQNQEVWNKKELT